MENSEPNEISLNEQELTVEETINEENDKASENDGKNDASETSADDCKLGEKVDDDDRNDCTDSPILDKDSSTSTPVKEQDTSTTGK